MKTIKLSGREASIIKAIGFGLGMKGGDIVERTGLPPEDVAEILEGLIDTGFVESNPVLQRVAPGDLAETDFEVNPSYAADLKTALRRG